MIFKPIFCNFIVIDELNLNLSEVIDFSYKLKSQNPSIKKSNNGGWHSDNLDEKNPFVNHLYDSVLSKLGVKIKDALSINENERFVIDNMWININNFGHWNNIHCHGDSLISGAFYVKVPKGNCGQIEFINPNRSLNYHKYKSKEYNEYNSTFWKIPPEENVILFFPSWLEHYVTPNLTKEDRISFSFNASLKNDT